MSNTTIFYLTSTEIRPTLIPRRCRVLQALWSEERGDYCLRIKIDLPINGRYFNISSEEIRELVVATRYSGVNLNPISDFPVTVYVCFTQNEEMQFTGKVIGKDLQILCIGELYRDFEEAEKAISFEPSRI